MTWARSALFYAWVVLATLALGLVAAGIRIVAPRHTHWLARRWAFSLLAGLRAICGVRWRVAGAEHLPREGAMLIASQHQSAFDTLVWMELLPRASYVFKSELARIPIIGPMLLASGQIPVRRAAGGTALPGLLREAERAAADRRQIVIFPQGTRTPPGVEVALRPGIAALARHTSLPVLPAALHSGHLWPKGSFRIRPGMVSIAVGPALEPDLDAQRLLDSVTAFWRRSERCWRSVDNSVGEL